MQITVHGYAGGPDDDLGWRIWNYDDQLKSFANNLRDACSTILLGRKMAEVFIKEQLRRNDLLLTIR